MSLTVWPHYTVFEGRNGIHSMADLRQLFPDGKANELNRCVLSTSGVHGSYSTLDEMHEPDEDGYINRHITVLVIQPRLVVLRCGNVDVETDEDEAFLRGLVESSLEMMAKSQDGNRAKPPDTLSGLDG